MDHPKAPVNTRFGAPPAFTDQQHHSNIEKCQECTMVTIRGLDSPYRCSQKSVIKQTFQFTLVDRPAASGVPTAKTPGGLTHTVSTQRGCDHQPGRSPFSPRSPTSCFILGQAQAPLSQSQAVPRDRPAFSFL